MDRRNQLRKMKRVNLLEILLEVTKENERLRVRNRKLAKRLASKEVVVSEAGSIAEASLKISGIFHVAQSAAEGYLASLKKAEENSDQLVSRAEEEAVQIMTQAEADSQQLRKQAEADSQKLRKQAKQDSEQMLKDAQEESKRMVEEARRESAELRSKARKQAALIKKRAKKDVDDMWQQTQTNINRVLETESTLNKAYGSLKKRGDE